MNQEYAEREVCMYWVNVQEQLVRGIQNPDTPFRDVDCKTCPLEHHSIILCEHYVNRIHMEESRRMFPNG